MAAATTSLPETSAGRATGTTGSPDPRLGVHARSPYRLGFGWEAGYCFVLDASAVTSAARPSCRSCGIGGERDLTEKTSTLSGTGARPVGSATAPKPETARRVGMILDALDVQFHQAAGQIVAPVWRGCPPSWTPRWSTGANPIGSGKSAANQALHRVKVMLGRGARGADLATNRRRRPRQAVVAPTRSRRSPRQGPIQPGVFRQHYKTDDLTPGCSAHHGFPPRRRAHRKPCSPSPTS